MRGLQESQRLESALNVNQLTGTERKKCIKCHVEKLLSEFQIRPCMKDGHRSDCKECVAHRNKMRYLANSESAKENQRKWNANNKDKKKEQARKWYESNRERAYELRKKWVENNPEKAKECQKKGQIKYAQTHKTEIRKRRIEKYAEDPAKFRARYSKWKEKDIEKARLLSRIASQKIRDTPRGTLNDRISAGIRQSLKGSKAGQKWESLVEYSLNDLKKHIEKQFEQDMTWEKLMAGEIHIDHIIPKSVFNFSDPKHADFKKCWSLKNLRPMWAAENLQKHNKLEKHFQPSLAI